MSAVGTNEGRSERTRSTFCRISARTSVDSGLEAVRLRHEVEGAELQRLEDVLALRVAAHHDDRRGRACAMTMRRNVKPSMRGISRSSVMTSGLSERHELQRLFAVGRLADDLDVRLAGEHLGDAAPVVGRVVDDEEADGRGLVGGTFTLGRPEPGWHCAPRAAFGTRGRLASVTARRRSRRSAATPSDRGEEPPRG